MARGRNRIEVEAVGDTSNLERALGRTERRLRSFGRSVDRGGTGVAGLFGSARAFGALAGGSALAVGLKKAIDASREAEIVLGQTKVAVDALGLGWQQNAGRIEGAADEISKAASFDDEEVLQSFQKIVRGTKDVDMALDRVSLAADVARGSYQDLAFGTNIVVKAQLGQIGALRRAGIQIDKNATATEALATLQRNFAGASEEYSNSSLAATERLSVAYENLAEKLGGPVTNALADVAEMTVFAISKLEQLGNVKLPGWLGDIGDVAGKVALGAVSPAGLVTKTIVDLVRDDKKEGRVIPGSLFGQPDFLRSALEPRTGGRARAGTTNPFADVPKLRASAKFKGMAQRIEGQILDARIAGDEDALLKGLIEARNVLQKQLASGRFQGEDKLKLKQALSGLTGEIRGIYEDNARDAESAADDAKDVADTAARDRKEQRERARAAAKESLEKMAQAARDVQDGLRERANDLREAALRALDQKGDTRNFDRELREAREQLAVALKIGSPTAIEDARAELGGVRLDRQRSLLEQATITPATRFDAQGRPVSAQGFNVSIGNIVLPNVQNAQQLVSQIQRIAKTGSTPRRGRYGGTNTGIG